MAKGQVAKDNLMKKFIKACGNDYIGEFDKKYYFWADENGEKVQIAISLTCPKTFVGKVSNEYGHDFSGEASVVVSSNRVNDISDEEKENIKKLMKSLNL